MALEHRSLHRAVVDRLGLRPDDRVLEIGFGPGTAIRLAALRAAHVSGIDVSGEMVQQALRRNRSAVRAGRVDLRVGTVSRLPYPDGSFTVVFEVNSLDHWDDQAQGLREMWRVLHGGGRLLLAVRGEQGTPLAAQTAKVVGLVEGEGFSVVASEQHHFGHGGAFLVARRP